MVWRNKIFEEEYKYKDNAIAFFEKLQKILGEKVKGLYIVPGNHDKIRNVMDKSVIEKYYAPKKEGKKQEFYRQYWKHLKMGSIPAPCFVIFVMEQSPSRTGRSCGCRIFTR